jgi:hypothetical protein
MEFFEDSKKTDQYEETAPLPRRVQFHDAQSEFNSAIDQDTAEKVRAPDELADPTNPKLKFQIDDEKKIAHPEKELACSESQRKVAEHELNMKLEQEPPQLAGEFKVLAVKFENEEHKQSGKPLDDASKAKEPSPSTAVQKMTESLNRVPSSAETSVAQGSDFYSPTSGPSKNPFEVENIEFLVSGTPSDGPRTTNVCPALRDILRQAAAKFDEEATIAANYSWFGGPRMVRCANTRAFGLAITNKTACLRCCHAKTPCVLTLAGKSPVVLPLAAPMLGATLYNVGYYVQKSSVDSSGTV